MDVSVIGGMDMCGERWRSILILKRHWHIWWCGEGICGAGARARWEQGI